MSPRPGRWPSQRSMVRPGKYTTKSHNRATTKNPKANIRNCQISDANTFLSTLATVAVQNMEENLTSGMHPPYEDQPGLTAQG